MSDSLVAELATAAVRGRAAFRETLDGLGGAPVAQGESTTFVYLGDADAVALVHWMDVFPPVPPFNRVAATDLWYLTLDLPRDARIEYRLQIRKGGHQRTVLDPLNPLHADNPFGVNSIVAGPGYQRPEWTLPNPATPAGQIQSLEIESTVWGTPRTIRLYSPAAGPDGPVPLLVAHDGSDYLEFAALATVLDNLIASGSIPPVAAALLDPADRNHEYTGLAAHAEHVVADVLPALSRVVTPSRRVVMGASLGAVASLHATWSHPGVFDAAILQSGSFATGLGGRFRRGSIFKPVVAFLGAFHSDPRPLPGAIYVSCGRFEGMLNENRALVEQLTGRGADVHFEVTPDGHDWGNWRNRLESAFHHTLEPADPSQ